MQISDEMIQAACAAFNERSGDYAHASPGAMRAALSAALSLSGWRTIDSAPKDGTGILAKLPDSDMPHTVKFWRGVWVLAWDHSALVNWDMPTHWKPLDTPPATAGKEG